MQLNKDNEWVKLAGQIDWHRLEETYADMFPSKKGRPAFPFRTAHGTLIIQKRLNLSDRKLVQAIAENPYLQYFIGLSQMRMECPFQAAALVYFRKRITVDFMNKANEQLLENAPATAEHEDDKEVVSDDGENLGTLILDATCSPSNIKYPMDFTLLNGARVKLEEMVDYFHEQYHPWDKLRTYRRTMWKEYLAVAKMRRRPAKKIRAFIRKLLGCLNRDLRYIEDYMAAVYAPASKFIDYYLTIVELYEQQKYMFDNKVHSIEHRIVSIHQPYIRPIVRGKAKAPVEFGAKYDVSIDEKGHARLEKIQYEPYNEGQILQDVIERYKDRTGHYPARILVDQIYRNRANRDYCKEHGIRISDPKLGRPAANHKASKAEYQDNTDRIEVERFLSLDKRCNGAGLIMARRGCGQKPEP